MLPEQEPWNRRFSAIHSLLWHPGLNCLLATDADNLCIVKVSLDGVVLGNFTLGAPHRPDVFTTVNMHLLEGGDIIATQFHSGRNENAIMLCFSKEGVFRGVVGYFSSGPLTWVAFQYPFGSDRVLTFDWRRNAITVADTAGYPVDRVSGYGFGRGFTVHVPGTAGSNMQGWCYDRKYGVFIADLARKTILQYAPDLTFVDELTPPGEALTFTPVCLSIGSKGDLHVVDGFRNRVIKFSARRHSSSGRQTWRYRYAREYAGDAGISIQRIYSQGNMMVLVDLFRNVAVRYNARLRRKDRITLPATFVASVASTPMPDGAFLIKGTGGDAFVRITPKGQVDSLRIRGVNQEASSMHSLERYSQWLGASRPPDAAYVLLDHRMGRQYLDRDLRVIRDDEEPLWENYTLTDDRITSFAIIDSTVYLGQRAFEGMVVCRPRQTPQFVPLALGSECIRVFEVKNDSTLGAITRNPARYVEISTDGRILCAMDSLPRWRSWYFSYSHNGNPVLGGRQVDHSAVVELDSQGRTVRLVKTGMDVNDVAVDSNGTWYVLSQSGRILEIDTLDNMRVVFNGKIHNEQDATACDWIEKWDDKLLVGDRRERILAIGIDGTYRGAIAGARNKELKDGYWEACRPPGGPLIVRGRKGIRSFHVSVRE